MRLSHVAAASVTLALVAVLAQPVPTSAPPATISPSVAAASAAGDLAVVSGTIRRVDATTWAALDDAGHLPTGIEAVTVTPTHVRVDYDFTASKVSSVQVTPDEAFAAADVRVGASVGLDYMLIFFYMGTSQTPVNPSLLTRAGANVWITGSFHVEAPVQ